MKVLFLYNGTYPEGMAMTNRLHLYGKGLFEQGIHTDIVFPSDRKLPVDGVYEGIKYTGIKNPVNNKNYLMHQLSATFAAFIYACYCLRNTKYYNVLLIVGFGWFASFLIIVFSHLRGIRVVMEVNENPYAPEGGRLDPVWIRKIRRQFMLRLPFHFTDGFIVISESLEKLVKKYNKKSAQIIRIPILIENKNELLTVSRDLKYPYIFHAGALSETKDGVIAMFEAFSKACKQLDVPLRFILTTKVMQPELLHKIESLININKIKDRVIFKGHLSKKELDELRNSCTLAVINKPSNWQNDYNFATKLGELMLAGIPVIASPTGEMGKYLRDNENAFIVPANDTDAIAEKILFILKNPDTANRVGHNGKNFALKEFNFIYYSDRLTTFFKTISSQ